MEAQNLLLTEFCSSVLVRLCGVSLLERVASHFRIWLMVHNELHENETVQSIIWKLEQQ